MSDAARVAVHAEATRPDSGGGLTYVTAFAAALADDLDVDLFAHFESSLAELATILPAWSPPSSSLQLHRAPRNRSWRDELRLARGDRRWAAVVRDTSYVPRLSFARRGVLVTSFPFDTATRPRDRARLASYRTIVANSAFTARWVRERWHRTAEVLHPPVTPVSPSAKRATILSVGRFTGGGRSKRQLEMVDAFRALGPSVHAEWELHLAGFVEDPTYLAAVRERAGRLPVTIHTDLDRSALEAHYSKASIFWHACGLGVDQEQEPHRVEHFGIATVEAMSAGCVPVVVDAGGQPEIVGRDDASGILWATEDEWVSATAELIDDPDRRERLGVAARARSARFSFDAFAPRARALVRGEP